jgi:hypothetical protein
MLKICKKCRRQFIPKFSSQAECGEKDCKKKKRTWERRIKPAEKSATPQRDKSKDRERHNLRVYGLTPDEYRRMAEAQDNRCAICGSTPRLLYVDHNHNTGKVRGLLCVSCNSALGLFRDSIGAIEKAAAYLKRYDHGE